MMKSNVGVSVLGSALLILGLGACSSDEESGPTPSKDAAVDTTPEDATGDATGDAGAESGLDAGEDVTTADVAVEAGEDAPEEASLPTLQEEEPNDGAAVDEYNDLPLVTVMTGAVGTVGDADIFRVPALPGKVYVATLSSGGSELQGNLTVMDTGRDGDPAGDDYVKLANAVSGTGTLAWLAMGDGDYFVIVRDSRNLTEATVGGAGYTYELVVQERPVSEFEGDGLDFALPVTDSLQGSGDVRLHPFDGEEGTDVVIGLTTSGDMDGRLMVFANSTGSWIARNDDQAYGNPDPKIDAPLMAGGAMWLVVENVDHEATTFDYAISSSKP